jgi:hypothetical protein
MLVGSRFHLLQQRALETAGIEFTNDTAPGVRLKSKARPQFRPTKLNASNDE